MQPEPAVPMPGVHQDKDRNEPGGSDARRLDGARNGMRGRGSQSDIDPRLCAAVLCALCSMLVTLLVVFKFVVSRPEQRQI